MILKEGYLCKKGGVIKSWSRRYFVLNHQCLCYFKRALNSAETDSGLQPLGRVFLSDIVDIETEGVEKKRAFVFSLNTKKRGVLLQASNYDDKEKWVDAVRQALETDKRAEREDPFRRTLRKLKSGEIESGERRTYKGESERERREWKVRCVCKGNFSWVTVCLRTSQSGDS